MYVWRTRLGRIGIGRPRQAEVKKGLTADRRDITTEKKKAGRKAGSSARSGRTTLMAYPAAPPSVTRPG